jgi:phosphate transport system substrate-binding protein
LKFAQISSENTLFRVAMQEQLQVGPYILEREIGEGGMAQVWQARHVHLGNKAAVKFLLPRLAGDPELEDRFLSEGKRQARLQHPNIVHAIDFVQQDGRSYLVMQYVEGKSLETRLTEGRLSLEEVHAISWDVLSALDYAHSLGVVHRDVKPSNILIEQTGRVWLTDFGIALALREERRITRTGTAVGTPDYMSPEQILRPREVDARSDIYSFGCVLYAMLAGGPPFGMDGATDFYIKDCHVRVPPPPLSQRNPSLHPGLERVVLQCLEKDPDSRLQDCRSVKYALDAALAAPPSSPPQAGALTYPERPLPPPPAPRLAARAMVIPPSPAPVPLSAVALKLPPPERVEPPPPEAKARPRKKRGWLLALAAILLLSGAGAAYFFFFLPPETVLRLEGSTTVGDALAPEMLKAFLQEEGATDIEEVAGSDANKDHRDVRARLAHHWRPALFSVVANGSPNAFKALAGDQADVGMSSRPISNDEAQQLAGLGDMRSPDCENIAALDGIAVILHPSNPVSRLTRQQIASIFSGAVVNWVNVGGPAAPIHLYGRSSGSGTYDTFVALVLSDEKGRKKPFASSLTTEENGEDIAKAVASDAAGIGYVGLAQTGNAKTVEVSDGPGTAWLVPSSFTVSTEDYVLSRRLFLYTPAHPTDWAKRFVAFALSADGQQVVKKVGYVEQAPRLETEKIPDGAPVAYRSRVEGLRRMSLNFRFRPNSTLLDNKALADIKRAFDALSAAGISSGVEVLGFADSQPPAGGASNQALSEQRAEVVAERLRAFGIAVQAAGFSSAMPVGDNDTPMGREKNRRVEVWVK